MISVKEILFTGWFTFSSAFLFSCSAITFLILDSEIMINSAIY